MNISHSWLKRYLKFDLDAVETGEILTEIGLETEKIHSIGGLPGGLKGVVVGKILSCEQHPNADRLKVTQVDVGADAPLAIVCGAPNATAGQTVLVATVGCTLHPNNGDPFKIKKSKLRGEISEGMICAEDELGIGDSHEGICVLDGQHAAGTPAASLFSEDEDHCLEIGLTPNRADAMGHYGVARDLHAALQYRGKNSALQLPSVEGFSEQPAELPIELTIEDPEGCPHYCGLLISGLEVKDSPEWLKKALESIQIKPINNVVDVTNFVLHETGHPLHAFDYDRIKGHKVVVRTAREGEKLTTLDEKERSLHPDDLLICNEEEAMCIGGVFGGQDSGVRSSTTTIFLESAYFDPVRIRKTAKRQGLNTDASYRYERGIDPNMSGYALKRAALLLEEVACGKVASKVIDSGQQHFPDFELRIQPERVQKLAGHQIPSEDMKRILQLLEIQIEEETPESWKLQVPPYRVDVREEADIVEEVLRIYGLDRIPIPEQVLLRADTDPLQPAHELKNKVANALVAFGFQETLHNSLHKSAHYAEDQRVGLLNPLSSDLDVLRNDPLPAGLETISRNQSHRVTDLKLFEFGKTYHRKDERYWENSFLAFWVCGSDRPENWNRATHPADLFTLKEGIHRCAATLGLQLKEKQKDNRLLFSVGKQKIGYAEGVSTQKKKAFGLEGEIYFASLDWERLSSLALAAPKSLKDLPKFPGTRRDIALLVDRSTSFSDLQQLIGSLPKSPIQRIGLFDVYEGKGLPEGKISYALNLWLQSEEKTLTDQEIESWIEKVIQLVKKQLGAELRQ